MSSTGNGIRRKLRDLVARGGGGGKMRRGKRKAAHVSNRRVRRRDQRNRTVGLIVLKRRETSRVVETKGWGGGKGGRF